ncbi:hypothetical protein MNBD_GAMMA21-2716 [hydrothermal vent metagenome]|uniref:FAD-binding domain-containing protein n=1 Tax=hydrothermal vent metagenome TaxID=652676 RepID=A0A3B1A0I9_9ZZZZ
MSSSKKLPLLIVGAGIGGLTAARALRRAGYDVEVFEQSKSFSPVGAGIGVMANGMKALRTLELDQAIMEKGAAFNHFSIRKADGTQLWAASEKYLKKVCSPSYGIMRPALHRILLDGCEGVSIHSDHRLENFTQDNAGVTAYFSNGREVRGQALIGADGLRSRTRELLLGYHAPRNVGMTAVLGHLDASTITNTEEISFRMGNGQSYIGFPVSKSVYMWSVMIKADKNGMDINTATLGGSDGGRTIGKDFLLKQFADWSSPVPELISNTDEKNYIRWDIFDRPYSKVWGKGRVTLLGDAIHPMAPTFGQGANQSIEDAIELAKSLSTSDDIISGLRCYEKRRQLRSRWIVEVAHKFVYFSLVTNPLVIKFRNGMLPVSNNFILGAALKWKG